MVVDGRSISLPEGERFFIRSLKHFGLTLADKELAAEINRYAVQEAFHTREHEDYNPALVALGYDVAKMEKPIRAALATVKKPLHRLAMTCAIEHLTATFSSMTLRQPEFLATAAPAYRRLWMWHALEELEHEAVALDVLRAATPDLPAWRRYLLRTLAMNATLFPFLMLFLRNVPVYARTDGVRTGFRYWSRFAWFVLVSPGVYTRCVVPVLWYCMPDFDPRKSDDDELVRRGRLWLANDLVRVDRSWRVSSRVFSRVLDAVENGAFPPTRKLVWRAV